jgi:hypothetical protein
LSHMPRQTRRCRSRRSCLRHLLCSRRKLAGAAQQGVAADELVGRPSASLWRSQLNAGTLAGISHIVGNGPAGLMCHMSSSSSPRKRSFVPNPREVFAFRIYSKKHTQSSELVALASDTERCELGL